MKEELGFFKSERACGDGFIRTYLLKTAACYANAGNSCESKPKQLLPQN